MNLSIENQNIEYNFSLKNSLTSLFNVIITEVIDTLECLGENKDDYCISIYPFSINRIDNKTIPKYIIDSIRENFN